MIQVVQLVLIGGGGHAAEVFSYLEDLKASGDAVDLLGVIDEQKSPGSWEGTHVLGGFDTLATLTAQGAVHYLTCVGSNALRRQLVSQAEVVGAIPWTLRHPTAQLGRDVQIGPGTLLAPGVIVTTRVRIGRHCILNARVGVHHDCVIGDFANLNPGATVAGTVKLGDGVFLGAGATVINGRTVGVNTVIGAGATVIHDLLNDVTAVGVPAKVIKQHQRIV